jgi:Cu-Zn family superoxide dismutase
MNRSVPTNNTRLRTSLAHQVRLVLALLYAVCAALTPTGLAAAQQLLPTPTPTLTPTPSTLFNQSPTATPFGLAPAVAGVTGQQQPSATAVVKDTVGHVLATAVFYQQTRNDIMVSMVLANPPRLTGAHGVQIHAVGSCLGPDFSSAGGIFNPTKKQHGHGSNGPEVGDLPNVNYTLGLTTYTAGIHGAMFAPGALNSLTGGAGTSLVIFERADDQATQPEGNAGARIGCGVIEPGPTSAELQALGTPSPTPSSGFAPAGQVSIGNPVAGAVAPGQVGGVGVFGTTTTPTPTPTTSFSSPTPTRTVLLTPTSTATLVRPTATVTPTPTRAAVAAVTAPGQPAAGQAVAGQTVAGQVAAAAQPVVGQPAVGQPVVGQPVAGQPAVGQPAVGQPAVGQPVAGQPAVGQPVGQPAVGQPVPGQPAVGQPVPGQPAVGQPLPGQVLPVSPINQAAAPVLPPPGGFVASPSAGNSLGVGTYRYALTFVTASGETTGGTEVGVTIPSGLQTVNLTAIPLGPAGTTARKLYRTPVNGAPGTERLASTITDNTTSSFTDAVLDQALNTSLPASNTAGVPAPGAASIATNGSGNLNGAYRYALTFVSPTGETTGGAEFGAAVTGNTVQLTNIPLGPTTTSARRIYRTAAGAVPGTEKLVASINDNATTVYYDNMADSSLGATIPTTNTAVLAAGQTLQPATGFGLTSGPGAPSALLIAVLIVVIAVVGYVFFRSRRRLA